MVERELTMPLRISVLSQSIRVWCSHLRLGRDGLQRPYQGRGCCGHRADGGLPSEGDGSRTDHRAGETRHYTGTSSAPEPEATGHWFDGANRSERIEIEPHPPPSIRGSQSRSAPRPLFVCACRHAFREPAAKRVNLGLPAGWRVNLELPMVPGVRRHDRNRPSRSSVRVPILRLTS